MKYLKIFEAFSKDKKIDKVNRIVDVFHTTKWLDTNTKLTFENGEYYFWYENKVLIIVNYKDYPEDEWRVFVDNTILIMVLRSITMARRPTSLESSVLRRPSFIYIHYCLRKYLANKLKEELGKHYFTMNVLSHEHFKSLYDWENRRYNIV